MSDRPTEISCSVLVGAAHARQQTDRPDRAASDELLASPWSYEVKMGREPIRLGWVEYRILKFLSSKPYHAFTPRRIAQAVDAAAHPVTEDTLAEYIASLRRELGFFADYVQSVPHVGYRFKA